MSEQSHEQEHTLSPPGLMVWAIVGLFVFIIIGSIIGVVVFVHILRPGQQQRIVNLLPVAAVFLPKQDTRAFAIPTPVGGQADGLPPEELLNISVHGSTDEPVILTETPQPTVTTAVPTIVPTLSTATPTAEPTVQVEISAAPPEQKPVADAPISLPIAHSLNGFTWELQTWNNCGPASISIALSYYGWQQGQEAAAAFLKPDAEDKNVRPGEMVAFVNQETRVRAITRMGGNIDLLKSFITNGFPVIISSGFMLEGEDWLGHYRTLVGYDDSQQTFYVYDSFLGAGDDGAGLRIPYSDLDRDWQHFNRNFIVIFNQDDEPQVRTLLGELADLTKAAEQALVTAQREARAEPRNGYAWFNVGTAFAALNRYDEAAAAYDQAFRLTLPFRMLWYQFGPFEAYFEAGRYDDVMALVTNNLSNGAEYVEETYYWQGRVLAARGSRDEAINAYRQALVHNPLYEDAQAELDSLVNS